MRAHARLHSELSQYNKTRKTKKKKCLLCRAYCQGGGGEYIKQKKNTFVIIMVLIFVIYCVKGVHHITHRITLLHMSCDTPLLTRTLIDYGSLFYKEWKFYTNVKREM